MNLVELLTPPNQNQERLKRMRRESQRRLKENIVNIKLANALLDKDKTIIWDSLGGGNAPILLLEYKVILFS